MKDIDSQLRDIDSDAIATGNFGGDFFGKDFHDSGLDPPGMLYTTICLHCQREIVVERNRKLRIHQCVCEHCEKPYHTDDPCGCEETEE